MKRALLVLLLVACGTPSPPPAVPDERIEGGTIQTCTLACVNLRKLSCPEGQPTKKGKTCETFCAEMRAQSDVQIPFDCVARSLSVDAVRACGFRCGSL